MRLHAIVAGLLTATIIPVAVNVPTHAQSQNNQQNNPVPQRAPAAPAPKLVEVQPGDSLIKIAAENQTTYPRIFDANENIQDPDIIHPGDKLRIPLPDEKLPSRPLPIKQPVAPVARQRSAPQTEISAPAPAIADGSVWDSLAQCESGGNWSINTGNGYYGGLQFSLRSWQGVGGTGYPHEASREEQISRGQMLQARQGWGAWPACSSRLGLR